MIGAPWSRRELLRGGVAASVLLLGSGWWRAALAAPAQPGTGPYGSLSSRPDANGLFLPDGFRSRVVAVSGQPVGDTSYRWHGLPDGAATFPTPDGGWVYASNSEVVAPKGGAGALRFDARGRVIDAYRILDGTGSNCAGGPTPWGTWLSCEERAGGHVWECDPTAPGQGVERPALGTFSHEAAAVDPAGKAVYLTEDDPAGRLYRFVPATYPDLATGQLQAAHVDDAGAVTWIEVSADAPDRNPDTTVFDGGEGIFRDRSLVAFTTKGDDRVWGLDTRRQRLTVLYDAHAVADPPLTGVDNITAHPRSRDLFVVEDGGNLEVCLITAPTRSGRRRVSSFARVAGPPQSELTGPAFTPDGTRLYFSSQRGTFDSKFGAGITFEVRGPFRKSARGS